MFFDLFRRTHSNLLLNKFGNIGTNGKKIKTFHVPQLKRRVCAPNVKLFSFTELYYLLGL